MLVYKFINYKFLFQIIHNYKLQVILLDLDLMIPLYFTKISNGHVCYITMHFLEP